MSILRWFTLEHTSEVAELLLKLLAIAAVLWGTLFLLRPQPTITEVETFLETNYREIHDLINEEDMAYAMPVVLSIHGFHTRIPDEFALTDFVLDDYSVYLIAETGGGLLAEIVVVNEGGATARGVRIVTPEGWAISDNNPPTFALAPGERRRVQLRTTYAGTYTYLTVEGEDPDPFDFQVVADDTAGIPNLGIVLVLAAVSLGVTALIVGAEIHRWRGHETNIATKNPAPPA